MSGHDAAIKAMDELFGPIIGITLVLMSVFMPAAFLPGLTGQMYAQFALVIAATALISAINAATLKPTQCALWLRPAVPPEKRNFFFRGFNDVYSKLENALRRLIGGMVAPQPADGAARARRWPASAAGASPACPRAFIPNEDQGYLMVGVQLPDGASLERTGAALERGHARSPWRRPGVEQVVAICAACRCSTTAPPWPMPASPT